MSPSRARLTTPGQAPQVIPSTESTIVDACAASATCATNSRTSIATQNPCLGFMVSPPAHAFHVVPGCAVSACVTQAGQEVGGRLGESVEHDGRHYDEARQNQQN